MYGNSNPLWRNNTYEEYGFSYHFGYQATLWTFQIGRSFFFFSLWQKWLLICPWMSYSFLWVRKILFYLNLCWRDSAAFGIVLGFELFSGFTSFSSASQMDMVIFLRIHLTSWNDKSAISVLYMWFLSEVTLGLSKSFFIKTRLQFICLVSDDFLLKLKLSDSCG